MPTVTNNNQSRYRTPKQLRNEPKDELEKQLQASEVDQQVERLLDRFPNEPEFQRMLAAALARRVLPQQEDFV
jgi:hypothetical protein